MPWMYDAVGKPRWESFGHPCIFCLDTGRPAITLHDFGSCACKGCRCPMGCPLSEDKVSPTPHPPRPSKHDH